MLHLEHETKERPGVLTGVGLGRRRGAGSSALRFCGGGRSEPGKELVVRVALDSSGLLGGTNCDQVALRSRARGHGGLRTTGGEELRRRRDLPMTGLG